MDLTDLLVRMALIIFVYVNAVFVLAWIIKDNGIMDIAWGIGFILITWYGLFASQSADLRQWIVTILVTVWGLRLSGHIFIRNLGRGEDFRYKNWREQWGRFAILRSYFQVYILQGTLIVVFSAPVWMIHVYSRGDLLFWDYIGAAIWFTGWFVESLADYQLLRFKKHRKDSSEIMQTGLWKYSRHPNYFGESVTWWGLGIMAISVPYGWITLISPALLTYFLLRVSGVSMLEKKYDDNPVYQRYIEETSAFIPLPPKSSS
jgi:steroid 5-alpha reductase family enzyme